MRRKCGGPGCEYRKKDRSQHSSKMHVKDIAAALCCPVEACTQIYYPAGWDSEMKQQAPKVSMDPAPQPTTSPVYSVLIIMDGFAIVHCISMAPPHFKASKPKFQY